MDHDEMLEKTRREALKHVYALLMAMDRWGAQEDGVSCQAWQAYRAAREFVGQPVPEDCPDSGSPDHVPYPRTKLSGREDD